MAECVSQKEPFVFVLLSYLRSFIATPLCFFWTFLYGSWAVVSLMFAPSHQRRDRIYRIWGRVCVFLFGIEVELRGEHHFPRSGERGAVCLFNHTSNFDIPIVNSVLKGSVRWGSKIELFHIPIFGSILRSMGVLPIARSHREEVFKVYAETVPRIAQGECFFLAPEGGRKDGSRIFPFKSGPFIFAIEAQCPLIPVIIYGSWKIQPKGQILPAWGRWRNKVIVEILSPIQTNNLYLKHRSDLQEKVYQLMSERFQQIRRELDPVRENRAGHEFCREQ